MKERPILFSGPMVRAILAGAKTQTRRICRDVTCQYSGHSEEVGPGLWRFAPTKDLVQHDDVACPYGRPGDRLWVRETWATTQDYDHVPLKAAGFYDADPIWFRAVDGDDRPGRGKWRPSIFMPRWASRLTLEVVAVRVERLQEITEEDAIAEGVDTVSMADVRRRATMCRRDDFAQLWDTINAKRGSWASNPWVWAVEFRRAALSQGESKESE